MPSSELPLSHVHVTVRAADETAANAVEDALREHFRVGDTFRYSQHVVSASPEHSRIEAHVITLTVDTLDD